VFLDASRVGGMETAMNGATQLVTQMQQGAPFPAVARQFSAAPTAANGGDAGWISPGEMPAEVDVALEQLRPGQLSKPIPVKDGVYIIYLRDKRAGAKTALVDLKQVAYPLAADATPPRSTRPPRCWRRLKPQITSCETLEATAGKIDGVVAGDLGEAEITDLAPAFQEAANTLQVGQVSDPDPHRRRPSPDRRLRQAPVGRQRPDPRPDREPPARPATGADLQALPA
jgi:peptidyl-prolyl cis-trans isomerase SurA